MDYTRHIFQIAYTLKKGAALPVAFKRASAQSFKFVIQSVLLGRQCCNYFVNYQQERGRN